MRSRILSILLALSVSACAAMEGDVQYGTVVDIGPVDVPGRQGAIIGGAMGAGAGSQMGDGDGALAASVGGGMAGAVMGGLAEILLTKQPQAYTVRMEDGEEIIARPCFEDEALTLDIGARARLSREGGGYCVEQ